LFLYKLNNEDERIQEIEIFTNKGKILIINLLFNGFPWYDENHDEDTKKNIIKIMIRSIIRGMICGIESFI
tara:strand:+ start:298 stop:510 length:213 start_codon:yes stop_codon:yes gene_type:complete